MKQERLLNLLTSIRLSWEGLAGTNTLAYYTHSNITPLKSFNIGPRKDFLTTILALGRESLLKGKALCN